MADNQEHPPIVGGPTSGEQSTADNGDAASGGEEVALPENFLDRSVGAITADLPTLNPTQLAAARALEEGGKTRTTMIAALDFELAQRAAAAEAAYEKPANRADYERAVLGSVTGYSALPGDLTLQLHFADGTTFLDGAINVERSDFRQAGRHFLYGEDVNFEPSQEPGHVSEAWLVAANGDAVSCRIIGGLSVGGGRRAAIPAGSLRF